MTYSKMRSEVEKAKRNGFKRTFCTKACFLATQTAERQPVEQPDRAIPIEELVTSAVTPTSTGRRTYYGPEVAAQSDGKNRVRACVSCGKVRKSKSPTCRECYQAARASTQLTATCSQCSEIFRRMRAEDEKKKRAGQTERFCSQACHGKWMSAHNVRTACPQCGTLFSGRGRKYCTPECRKEARPPKRTKKCPACATVFEYSSTRQQYCTRKCANEAHSLRMVGAGNSHYKDGTSYAEWFRLMRPLILERDQDQCRACSRPNYLVPTGRMSGQLVKSSLCIHHLNEDPADNRPENLIALCHGCHGIHHKSATTPFPWFATYTESATRSMTSKWTATVTSLQTKYSSTTA